MNIKKYTRFVNEEITIKGSPGIPGEGPREEGETDYLRTRLEQELRAKGMSPADVSGARPGRKEMDLMGRFMGLVGELGRYCSGKEKELTDLATDVIKTYFAGIIARYGMKLDLAILRPGQIQPWMDQQDEDVDLDDIPEMMPQMELEFRRITDPKLRAEVHKRKIANLITQGEAKNTSQLINSPESRDGINKIFGANGARVSQLLNDILNTIYGRDLVMNPQAIADMMIANPQGMAGGSSVGLEGGGGEGDDEDEEGEAFTPVIRARGVDYFILIHEAVKAIHEFCTLPGLPEEEEDRRIVFTLNPLADEPEDWKYGPIVAADLRDFLNDAIEKYEKDNKIGDLEAKHGNVRTEIWKWIMDRNNMEAEDFLKLIRGCLSKTKTAQDEMQGIIKKVIKLIGDLEEYNKQMAEYEEQMREYEERMRDYEESEYESDYDDDGEGEMWFGDDEEDETDYTPPARASQAQPEPGVDYSKMSKRELEDLMNDALDRGDYDLLSKISPFIKEARSYSRKYGRRF